MRKRAKSESVLSKKKSNVEWEREESTKIEAKKIKYLIHLGFCNLWGGPGPRQLFQIMHQLEEP